MIKPKGQIALIAVLLVVSVSMIIVLSLNILAIGETRMVSALENSMQSYYLADSCQEEAFIKLLRNGNAYSGESLSLSVGDCDIDVNIQSENNFEVSVTADTSSRYRKIRSQVLREFVDPDYFMSLTAWDEVIDF